MVARFRIIAIDFHTPYKGNNFRNNTDESVNLESLNYYYEIACGYMCSLLVTELQIVG